MDNKGEVKLLGKIVMVLVIVGLLVFIIPKYLYGGMSEASVIKCKATFDFDRDTFIGMDDPCPCDYGKLADQNFVALKGSNCVYDLTTNDDGTLTFTFRDNKNKAACIDVYKNIIQGHAECGSFSEDSFLTIKNVKVTADNPSPSERTCADILFPKNSAIFKDDGFVRACATSTSECDNDFKQSEECKSGLIK